MNQDKVPFFSLIIFIVLAIIACKGTIESVGVEGEYDYVAVTAHYYKTSDSQIYLVNYDNPSQFTRITNGQYGYVNQKFSPDKQYLIIGDVGMGSLGSPGLVLYDIKEKWSRLLIIIGPDLDHPLPGNNVVWHPTEEVIYFYALESFALPDINYYNLLTGEHIIIRHNNSEGEMVVDFIDANTMITWSSRHRDLGTEDNGYYLMDTDGNFLSRITNPHLVQIVVDDIIKQSASNLRYNPRSKLLVFSQRDSMLSGKHIAITNLEGTYFKRYTTGYLDDYPCWGPDDDIVLFDRAEISDKGRNYTTIMKLNLSNGNVTEFLGLSALDGATGISCPDY